MHTTKIPRLFSLYYSLVAMYICWTGIIEPARALLRGFGDWLSIPFLIIPAFMVVLILLFAAYSLYVRLSYCYEAALIVHCGLFIVISIIFLVSRSTGIIALTVHACVLVLYFFPRTLQAFAAQSQPRSQTSPGLTKYVKRVLVIGISVAVLSLVAWCGISDYTMRTMSSSAVMLRLAGLPSGGATNDAIRQALLAQVPRGTTKKDIRAFLESKNVPRDQFTGGQFARYQVEPFAILALFTDPPWTITVFCSHGNHGIRFVFDTQDQLTDIIVENYSRCL